MDYENAVAFSGSPEEGMTRIEATFEPEGFRVDKIRSTEWELIGPGVLGSSGGKNNKNPLRYVSRATVRITDNRIQMEAAFGTLRIVQKILVYAVPIIDLATALGLYVSTRNGFTAGIIASTVVPWFFIASYLNGKLERDTIAALDAVLEGIAMEAS